MPKFSGLTLVYTSNGDRKMSNLIERTDESRFANGKISRDLRDNLDDIARDPQDLREYADSGDGLEALRKDSDEDLERRIELPAGVDGKHGTSDGGPWYRRISKRVLLVAMLILAIAAISPFA